MTCAAVVASSLALMAHAQDDIGYCDVCKMLNDQIAPSPDYDSCVFFGGGNGILIRSPDGYENDDSKLVVPGTFWTNDLFMPSQIYPGDASPKCPSDTEDCAEDPNTGDRGPWNSAQFGMVIGSAMEKLFADYSNIQSLDWGWGVFYSRDSNAVDMRCRWHPESNGYDCPGGWQGWEADSFQYDESFKGAGGYHAGNPNSGGDGGGAGCHFGLQSFMIDQVNADDGSGTKLVQDSDCQCNYDLLHNANDWVDHWISYGGYTGPEESLDPAICWVNNPRDMIKLQNALFWRVSEWNDGSMPFARWGDGSDPASQRPYWGWNEIPVDKAAVSDPLNWDAVMIKLPAMLSGKGTEDRLSMLGWGQGVNLEMFISYYISLGILVPGVDNAMARPGSSIVVAREWMNDGFNYQREFFCESWTTPNGYYNIVYDAGTGACYVEEVTASVSLQKIPQKLNYRSHTNSSHEAPVRSSAIAV